MKENENVTDEVLDEVFVETVSETVGETVGEPEVPEVLETPEDSEVTEETEEPELPEIPELPEEPEEPPEPTQYTDDDGTWIDYHNGVKMLLEPSEAWKEANRMEPRKKPARSSASVWDELAAAYAEGVNSLDK
jgi:hypothetical protein